MDHMPNILVSLDIDRERVVIQVIGCVTSKNYEELSSSVRRTRSLVGSLPVTVDFYPAQHIDAHAIDHLQLLAADEKLAPDERISINAPQQLPVCPTQCRSVPVPDRVEESLASTPQVAGAQSVEKRRESSAYEEFHRSLAASHPSSAMGAPHFLVTGLQQLRDRAWIDANENLIPVSDPDSHRLERFPGREPGTVPQMYAAGLQVSHWP